MLFTVGAMAVTVVVVLLRMRGELHHSLGPLGAQLTQAGLLDELLEHEQPISGEDRVLVLNGQRLSLDTERVAASVETVLEEFLEECPSGSQLGPPVISDGRGYAICARPPEGSSDSLTSRLEMFQDTYDLGRLGQLEYAYAMEDANGKTSVLHLSSGDQFAVDQLLPPPGGDVAGEDPSDFPRPPDGVRVLHSYEDGLPYSLFVYGRSEKTPDELRAWYRAHVDDSVWVELDLDAEAERRGIRTTEARPLVFARRTELTSFVLVELEERPPSEFRSGRTMVAIAEAR